MTTNAAELVAQAMKEIETITAQEAERLRQEGKAVLVDIRDVRELAREGEIEDAVHAPRGMLEFWVDPQSPYHREVFAQKDKKYVLFCAAAGRSALACRDLQNMGFGPVAHIEGGFTAWRAQGLDILAPDS